MEAMEKVQLPRNQANLISTEPLLPLQNSISHFCWETLLLHFLDMRLFCGQVWGTLTCHIPIQRCATNLSIGEALQSRWPFNILFPLTTSSVIEFPRTHVGCYNISLSVPKKLSRSQKTNLQPCTTFNSLLFLSHLHMPERFTTTPCSACNFSSGLFS